MDAITDTAARANLAQTMNRVCGDHEPLIITRNGQPCVVMPMPGAFSMPSRILRQDRVAPMLWRTTTRNEADLR
ncbi:MAG: type II toxin-antitoxin system Phd/YefM family antitoxin [Synechococcaceae cyanobacterium]